MNVEKMLSVLRRVRNQTALVTVNDAYVTGIDQPSLNHNHLTLITWQHGDPQYGGPDPEPMSVGQLEQELGAMFKAGRFSGSEQTNADVADYTPIWADNAPRAKLFGLDLVTEPGRSDTQAIIAYEIRDVTLALIAVDTSDYSW